jgi:hypothetical protein
MRERGRKTPSCRDSACQVASPSVAGCFALIPFGQDFLVELQLLNQPYRDEGAAIDHMSLAVRPLTTGCALLIFQFECCIHAILRPRACAQIARLSPM